MAREEIIAAPLELYLAPAGESFPGIDESVDGEFELVGSSGDENYTDDGVTVGLPQSIEEFIPAGSAMAVKAFRTEEAVEITVVVADVRAEILQYALNGNSIDETTGQREVSLLRGLNVTEYALLARGASPYEDDSATNVGQFQVPRCYQSAEPEPVWNKGEPAGVELTFRSLKPDNPDDFKVVYSDDEIT
ncbi:MAG: hypothetical protein ACODAB_09840 [Gemmatimonadota bacterium]